MILKTYIEPPIENNNYLLIDEESKDAILIDCSSFDDNIQLALDEYDAKLKCVLLTHGHFDHIAGIRNNRTYPVYMHEADMGWVNNVNRYLPIFGIGDIQIPRIDKFIHDGDIITLGKNEIKVITTPGHTQGGVCYLVNDMLFSGDTIFRESVGRCDLEGGDYSQLVDSIKNKIFTLSHEIKIYPGHGRLTTVEWEKVHNNFM